VENSTEQSPETIRGLQLARRALCAKTRKQTRAQLPPPLPRLSSSMALRRRPLFHVAPKCGWVNDPNGVFYDGRGRYHLCVFKVLGFGSASPLCCAVLCCACCTPCLPCPTPRHATPHHTTPHHTTPRLRHPHHAHAHAHAHAQLLPDAPTARNQLDLGPLLGPRRLCRPGAVAPPAARPPAHPRGPRCGRLLQR